MIIETETTQNYRFGPWEWSVDFIANYAPYVQLRIPDGAQAKILIDSPQAKFMEWEDRGDG